MAIRPGFLGFFLIVVVILVASSSRFVYADAGVEDQDVANAGIAWSQEDGASKVALLKEVSELKSRVSILETNLRDAKRESIEKSRKIVLLEGEVDSFQNRAGGDLESKLQASEANAADSAKQAKHLEESVLKLEKTLRTSEQRLDSAEGKNSELLAKVATLEKTVGDLRKKLKDAQQQLRTAENAMAQAQSEAAAKAQELYKVYSAWLPPWAAGQMTQMQTKGFVYWSTYAEPLVKKTAKQISQHAVTAQKWAEPHVSTIKEKAGPFARKYWREISKTASSKSEVAVGKLRHWYESVCHHAYPYVENAMEHVEPYVQIVKEKSRPHVDRVAEYIRPAYVAAEPYVEKARVGYKQAVKSAASGHQEVQKVIRSMLLQHESSAALGASKEIVWFLSLVVIGLPCGIVLLLITSAFGGGKKPQVPADSNRVRKHRRSNKTPSSAA